MWWVFRLLGFWMFVCVCVYEYVFISDLDRSRSSQSRNDPTHSLLLPGGMEIVRGANGESGGRKECE